jgi:hypothetical protein
MHKAVQVKVQGVSKGGSATPSWYKTYLRVTDGGGKEHDAFLARTGSEDLDDALQYLQLLVTDVDFREKEGAMFKNALEMH